MTFYRLFSGVNGPSAATAYSGGYQAGVAFEIDKPLWLYGYSFWCCETGQQVSPVTFATWQCATADSPFAPVLVPGSPVTSVELVAGQWNDTLLAVPLLLSPSGVGAAYTGVCGYMSTTGFPLVNAQFGSGDPYVNGITAGPLTGFSDQTGNLPAPESTSQGLFGTGTVSGGSASANFSGMGSSGGGNFFVDVILSDVAPENGLYSIWPGYPAPVPSTLTGNDAAVIANEFSVTVPMVVLEVRHYSPPANATVLPTGAVVWDIGTELPVIEVTDAAWSGAAASGWVNCTNLPAGVVLVPGKKYKVSTYSGEESDSYWFAAAAGYYVSGPGSEGFDYGVLVVPGNASATAPGQGTYNLTTLAYPDTTDGEGYYVDIVLQAVAGSDSGNSWMLAAGVL